MAVRRAQLVGDGERAVVHLRVLRIQRRFTGLEIFLTIGSGRDSSGWRITACRAYVERAVARSSFKKAHADQLAHFAAADGKKLP
jgi:hypothetical protein